MLGQEAAFRKVVQATMVRDRQHGPVVELNRIQVDGMQPFERLFPYLFVPSPLSFSHWECVFQAGFKACDVFHKGFFCSESSESAPACLQEVLDLPHSSVESCHVWKFMAARAFIDFLRKLFKTKAKHHVDLLSPCR